MLAGMLLTHHKFLSAILRWWQQENKCIPHALIWQRSSYLTVEWCNSCQEPKSLNWRLYGCMRISSESIRRRFATALNSLPEICVSDSSILCRFTPAAGHAPWRWVSNHWKCKTEHCHQWQMTENWRQLRRYPIARWNIADNQSPQSSRNNVNLSKMMNNINFLMSTTVQP